MNTNVSLISQTSRKPFSGKNDYYALFSNAPPEGSLLEAISGLAPFDVTGTMISEMMRDAAVSRLNRYRKGWNFYLGNHWVQPYEDGEEKPVVNFCKKIVDEGVNWFVADGWKTTSPGGNEEVAELIDRCWDYNDKLQVTERLTQYGAITGDAYIYVTLETLDKDGNELPEDQQRVRLFALNPSYCFPIWNPLHPGEMVSILIQFPLVVEGQQVRSLFTLYITADKWTTWLNDHKAEEQPNPFGKINVVHIPNLLLANSVYGQNDIHQVTQLNEEYNVIANSVRKIIKYHAEPTTIVYGAKTSDLEKGAKKIWSNLPIDARIENLVLNSDLKAVYEYMDRLERQMAELSSTPRLIFDSKDLRMSNTSGLAMQMLFQPLIEKTKKRRVNYRKGIQKVNQLIVIGHELLGFDVGLIADKPDLVYITDTIFTSPLPRDEQAELAAAQLKVNLGIWSRAEAIRRLSDVSDGRRLALELAADDRYTLAMAAETAKATGGGLPNLTAPFLSSVMLTQDFNNLLEQVNAIEAESVNTLPIPEPPPAPVVVSKPLEK